MDFKYRYSNFNDYPHYVYVKAFLVNGKLADYKIGNSERGWENRTFRGSSWEKEVWQHGFLDRDWKLDCIYHSEWVRNNEEHNNAFDKLENWLKETFKNNMMEHIRFTN